MPTMQAVTTHQLAALVAVEREAHERYRKATQAIYRVLWTYNGVENDAYKTASDEEEAAVRAMVTAQMAVDEALSVVRDGVPA
ncbi:MAG: hypothetical protein BGO26_16645 [Actinobacteria bacterium 69-20]|nr:hypothetical protein [Actinomycetota bacterium]OJV27101.1 MAG: hypothetical protein BGO26_16645 [Actinobacteria bacterium 69-20]